MKSLNKITDYIQNSFFKVLLVVGMLLPLLVMAQLPVQVNGNLFPPYSVKLSDYATANSDRLVFNLLLRDVNEFNRQVTLKLSIEGNNGFSARSTDVIIGENPITLNGGVPKRLTNIDLRPYFQLENLVGISPQQYSKPLAAGLYQFCFEVYDYLSGQQLGEKGCATAYIVLNDPPILNMPGRGENVAFRDSQNIIFQWTPRHINATNVQYEFTLVEIWDTNIDPQAAFLAGRPLYQTTTRSTTLLYGPAETPLLPDKTYGWRVQAIVTDGISELSLFKNKGYSEIFHFNYTKQCTPPQFVLAESNSNSSAMVYWQGVDHSQYQIQYRKKDGDNANWYEVNSYSEQARIQRLQESTTYEYRVGGKCGENGGYTFSRLFEFTTTTRGGSDFTCGVTPEQHIDNQEPLQTLVVNEVFTAGEFPITVKRVTAGNTEAPAIGEIAQGGTGRFSGWGYITVPYLADTKIKIGFVDIKINTDYELVDGVLVTDYDPNWSGMDDVSDELATLEDLIQDIRETIDGLYQNGQISGQQRDYEREQLAQLEATAEQAGEALHTATENLESVKENGTEQEIEEAQKEVEDKEHSVSEARKALEQKSKDLKSLSQQGELKEDPSGFFDGYLPITYTGDGIVIERPDKQGTFYIPAKDTSSTKEPFYENFTRNIEGTSYTFIFTSSASSAEGIKKARAAVNNPTGDIAIYYHYDTDNGQLGYKVEMSREYFGPGIKQEEFDWSRQAFKRGIKNMIRDINAVEDWSAEILDIAERLNKYRIKPLLAETKMPEELWNPDDPGYTIQPVHFPPIGAGLTDGSLEEATGIAQLVSLVIDYTTNKQVKEQIDETISNIDTDAVLDYAEQFVENRSELYQTGTYHQIEYQSGKDVVTIAMAATGITTTAKALKESVEFVKDLTNAVRKKVDDIKIFKNVDELVTDIVRNRKKVRDVMDTKEGIEYAKKYFDKYVNGEQFEEWWAYAKRYDLKDDLNFEVHHVIPIKVFEKNKQLQELLYWAHKQGEKFDFNGIDNGIPLQKKKAKIDLNGHTNHPKYDVAITDKINTILNNPILDDLDKFNEIQSLIKSIKDKLEKEVLLGTKDVNQIINFQ